MTWTNEKKKRLFIILFVIGILQLAGNSYHVIVSWRTLFNFDKVISVLKIIFYLLFSLGFWIKYKKQIVVKPN